MGPKRKALDDSSKTPVKKMSLDWNKMNDKSLNTKKKTALTSILKDSPKCPSPGRNKSVTFPPPSNMREALSELGAETSAATMLLEQLESLEGSSLAMWLSELQGHISLLDRRPGQGGENVENLVTELLKLKWADKVNEVAESYTSFLVDLVSACPCYTRQTVKSLFLLFKPSGEDDQKVQDSLIFRRAHTALKAILTVSPVGAREEVLAQMGTLFPFYKIAAYRQVCFVSALLEMTKYVADSMHHILVIIVEKIIRLDAHLSRDHIESAYEEEDGKVDNMVTALDLLLRLMLTYIKDNTHTDGVFDEIKSQPVTDCLLQIYTSHLLPTYNIVHTQFLVFYLVNLSPGLTQRFLAITWRTFSSPNTPSIMRQSAMSYMASFLSRSASVSTPQLLAHLTKLTTWCHSYVRNKEEEDSRIDFMYTDLARHGPFYSACQAIFYIFAFRHEDLTSSTRRMKVMQGLAWQSLVVSGLNPLKVCLPGVVRNFSVCAKHYQLAYCQAVIERNNRINLAVVGNLSTASSTSGKPNLLDCFFPFDPCLLRSCTKWIDPSYLQYRGMVGIIEEEDEDEEEMDVSEDENDGKEDEDENKNEESKKERRPRLDSSRLSLSNMEPLSPINRRDSIGCLNDLLSQDMTPLKT